MRHSNCGRSATGIRSKTLTPRAALAAAATVLLPAHALAVERTWSNSAGGTFAQGSNWLGGISPAPADTASFRLNSPTLYNVNFNSSVENLSLTVNEDRPAFQLGGFTYTLTSPVDAILVGIGSNQSTSFFVANGTLATSNASGRVVLARGDSSNAQISLFSNARLAVAGDLFIGSVGSGNISVASGSVTARQANLGTSPGSFGSVNISGSNSTWTSNLSIASGGNGAFTARNGASVTSPQSLLVAAGSDDRGTLTLSDANTSYTGSTLNMAASPGALATINVLSGARFSHARGFIGGDAGALAVVNIHTATWNSSDSFQTGAQGASALITATDSRITTTGVILGNDAGGTTVARFAGFTTSWTNNGSLTVAGAGDASLELAASTARSTGGMVIARDAGSSGRATVSDFGRLVVTGSPLTIARGGSGSLTLKQFSSASAPDVEVGYLITGDGALTVQGTGTTLGATTATFGANGRATVRITEGAVVSLAGSASLAANPGSFADVLVTGAESALNAAQVVVGGAAGPGGGKGGNATLTVGPGGRLVSSTSVTLWSTGTINLDGGTFTAAALVNNGGAFNFNGGTLNLTGPTTPFNVATSGPLGPILQLRTGQTINATNQVTIQSNALLRLEGGAFNAAGTFQNQGEIQLAHPTSRIGGSTTLTNTGLITGDGHVQTRVNNQAGGEIRANPGQRVRFTGSVTNAGVINLLGGIAEFDGPLFVTGTGRITGRGTLLVGAGLTNGGQLQLSAGLTDVHGNVDSAPGSNVIVTGQATATFYDNVTLAPGAEFRVSTNSTAVFFGNVTGAAANFTGAGAKYFEAGAAASLAVLDTPGSTTVQQGATLTVDRVRETALTVHGAVNIRPNGSSSGISKLNHLTITPPGTFDLADNALILDYAPTDPSPLPDVRADIRSAYDNGTWTGPGLTSSTAAANPSGALGYAQAIDIFNFDAGPVTFGDHGIDPTTLLIRHTLKGDTNLDGRVNFDDLARLAQNYNNTDGNRLWTHGDFTYDGLVNFDDLAALAQNYNTSLPTAAIPGAPAAFENDLARALTQVPEPSLALSALLAGGLSTQSRRRRRPLTRSMRERAG